MAGGRTNEHFKILNTLTHVSFVSDEMLPDVSFTGVEAPKLLTVRPGQKKTKTSSKCQTDTEVLKVVLFWAATFICKASGRTQCQYCLGPA